MRTHVSNLTTEAGPKRSWQRLALASVALLALATPMVGCGPQVFLASTTDKDISPAGYFMVPPRVDFVLAEDDTGSAYEMYPSVSQQLPQFLNTLQGKGWDYHFATTPLTAYRAARQVLASQYDSNWGSSWLPPYPGAMPGGPGTVTQSFFRFPQNYSDFLSVYDISSASQGLEPGLKNISDFLYYGVGGSNLIRPDALLVVLVLGNGEDTSGVNMCYRGDGVRMPCDLAGQPDGSMQTSYSNYLNWFRNYKGGAARIRWYSAVAASSVSNCLGARSYRGNRYMQMATDLGGQSYDICTTAISTFLSDLSHHLQMQKLAMRYHYLFIDREPNPATIVVTRHYASGTSAIIPQNASNGWTYATSGQPLQNVYAIDYPVPMAPGSGYAIELHGSGKLAGDEYATVTYKLAGAEDSVSQ